MTHALNSPLSFTGVNPASLLSTEFAFIFKNERNRHFSLLYSVIILEGRT